jgi:hypothetical protein
LLKGVKGQKEETERDGAAAGNVDRSGITASYCGRRAHDWEERERARSGMLVSGTDHYSCEKVVGMERCLWC